MVTMPVPKEQIEEEERARRFSSKGHWELSTAVTTNHLISAIALANTFKSMRSATFVPEQEKRRRLHRRLSRADSCAFMMTPAEGVVDSSGALAVLQEVLSQQQADIRQGWSLLAALHTILLPDLVDTADFKQPQVEILARRWQDRCFEGRSGLEGEAMLCAVGHHEDDDAAGDPHEPCHLERVGNHTFWQFRRRVGAHTARLCISQPKQARRRLQQRK